MKKVLLLLTASVLTISCTQMEADSIQLNSEDEKAFYTIGYSWGEKLKGLNISQREFQALIKGASTSVKGRKPEVDLKQYSARIGQIAKVRSESSSSKEKEKGQKFIANYLKIILKQRKQLLVLFMKS